MYGVHYRELYRQQVRVARYYKYWYKCTGITLNSMLLANMKKFQKYQYTEMLIDTIQHQVTGQQSFNYNMRQTARESQQQHLIFDIMMSEVLFQLKIESKMSVKTISVQGYYSLFIITLYILYIIHSLFIVTLVYGLKVRKVMDYNLDEKRGNSQKNLNCKGNKTFETSTEQRFQFSY